MVSETNARKDFKVDRMAIPDWGKVESLVIVYPQKLPGRNKLIKFYNKFIKTLPEDLNLIIIVKDNEVEKRVQASFSKRNIETLIIQEVTDIWIRDWGPITTIEQGIKSPVKFVYRRSYFKESDRHYADSDNKAGELIGKLLVQGEGNL